MLRRKDPEIKGSTEALELPGFSYAPDFAFPFTPRPRQLPDDPAEMKQLLVEMDAALKSKDETLAAKNGELAAKNGELRIMDKYVKSVEHVEAAMRARIMSLESKWEKAFAFSCGTF